MAVTDILLAGADLWYAPVGEALPDPSTIGPGDDWGGNWISLGVMSAPLTLIEETEVTDHLKNSALAVVKRSRKSQLFSFQSALDEINATHEALVRGYDPANVVTTTAAGPAQIGMDLFDPNSGGGCGRNIAEWQLGAEGILCTPTDDLAFHRVFIEKGNFMPDGDLVFDGQGDGVVLPFVFKSLWVPAHAKGLAYKLQRMTAVATA